MKYAPIALVLSAIILAFSSMYVVSEHEQAFVTRFGKIQGEPKLNPGLYFKLPLSDEVHRFESRILEWDGRPSESITQDKKTIRIDTYARWRIEDPILFFEKLKDEDLARSRLSAILDGATRTAVSQHDLVEVIRSVPREEVLVGDSNQTAAREQKLQEFVKGRQKISNEILKESKPKVFEFGIILLDFRFKRINYSAKVQGAQFARMIAEREKIAAEFRSKGQGGAEEWLGRKLKELDRINSEATLKERILLGEADAEAARIYAEAYSKSPEAREFYKFIKTMETYTEVLSHKDLMILSTKSEFFNFLREINPASKAGPK